MASHTKRVRLGDPDYEETLLKWFNEADSDCENSDNSDLDDNYEHSDHETDSEQEGEEDYNECDNVSESGEKNDRDEELDRIESESENNQGKKTYIYGKNRFKWSSVHPVRNIRTPSHNIVRIPAAVPLPQNSCDYIFGRLFSESMVDRILECSNKKIYSIRANYKRDNRSELADIDAVEFKSFLGLLLYSSIFKSNHEDVDSLFATDGTGRDLFRCVMSKKRFLTILSVLRFDDSLTRDERKKNNPCAAISELFDTFISNCKTLYSVGTTCCVDEMLVSFRGRCKFKMYMPMKPCKYGIKIMCITDAKSTYLFNAYIYGGKNTDGVGLHENEKKLAIPTQSVLRLCQPVYNTNRNITADNWFSSIELVHKLKEKGLTYVGTLKKNKKEVPGSFLPNKKRTLEETLYGFTREVTMISHVPKKNKAVLLVSSMHHSESIDNDTGKPEIISFYNATKGGVDALDEKCSKYSSSRRTRRWPMVIFFRILDIASSNAYVVYSSANPDNKISRFTFIKNLANDLVTPQLTRRLANPKIPREIRMNISRVLQLPVPVDETVEEKLPTRKTCLICPPKLKKRTSYVCKECKKPTCLDCLKKVCVNCYNRS